MYPTYCTENHHIDIVSIMRTDTGSLAGSGLAANNGVIQVIDTVVLPN